MNALVDSSAANAVMNSVDADPFGVGAENAGQLTFVKFKGASGEFLAGADEEPIEHGTQFLVDIFNAKWIWTFWWDGKPLETVEALLREDPLLYKNEPDFLPDDDDVDMTLEEIRKMQKEDPANFRDGWQVNATFNMVPLDNADEEYAMRLGGTVSLNAFDALRRAYSRRYKLEVGKRPVVELSTNKYKSKIKGVGTRHAPVLKIVDWMSDDELLAANGRDDDDYGDIDPEQASLPAPETTAEPEDEKPATSRGRRGARGRNLG